MNRNFEIKHLGNIQEQERILRISEELLRLNQNCINNVLKSISDLEIQLQESKDYLLQNITWISRQLETSESTATSPSKLSILIADDDPDIRQLLSTFFRDQNISVVEISNGVEALLRFYYGNFDLVLTDISMPGINGNLLARHIKNISQNVPIVALTGSSELAGDLFDRVISKPFNVMDLLKIIEDFLQEPSLATKPDHHSNLITHKQSTSIVS